MTCSELLITGENGGNIKPRSIMQIIPPDMKSLIKSFFFVCVCAIILCSFKLQGSRITQDLVG